MTVTDTTIMTNQLVVTNWNFDKIDGDFDIYQVVLDKHSDRNILNTQDTSVRILSTVYCSGQQSFVLTRKGATDEVTLQYILNKEADGKCAVRRLRLKQLSRKSEEFRKIFGYRGRSLLQLLINSTLNAIFEEDEYQNITGRCYYFNPEWIDSTKQIEVVDLTLERDMVLYPSVVTFVKDRPKDVRSPERIVFDMSSGSIRKALKGDKEEFVYYRHGIDGAHASRAVDGTTLQYWERSRMSCLARFFREVMPAIADYATVTLSRLDARKVATDDLTIGTEAVAAVLRDSGVNLIDSVRFTDQELTPVDGKESGHVNWIKKSKEAYHSAIKSFCIDGAIPYTEGDKDLYRLNVEIVREKKFYEIHKDLKDPYAPDNGVVCQHATVPVIFQTKKEEPVKAFTDKTATLLKELVIKADLRDGQIRLVKWGRYDVRRPLCFYMARSCSTGDERKGQHPIQYTGMTIQPDGSFTQDVFRSTDDDTPLRKAVKKCFQRQNLDNTFFDRNVELVVFPEGEPGNAYIIRRTNIRAISNVEEMEKDFMSEKADALLDTASVLSAIEPLQYDRNPSYVEVYNNICSVIWNKEQILKSDLLPSLVVKAEGKKPVICRKAKEAIANATGVVLKVSTRSRSNEERLGTGVYRHIHLWTAPEFDDGDIQEPATVFCYTVGQYGMLNQSIPTLPVVRQIRRLDGSLPSESVVMTLIRMMQVGFVRMKNYTVLPFPAKYLREIKQQPE